MAVGVERGTACERTTVAALCRLRTKLCDPESGRAAEVVVVAVGMSDLCGGRPLLLLPSFVATI
jgi:hypothetical protein